MFELHESTWVNRKTKKQASAKEVSDYIAKMHARYRVSLGVLAVVAVILLWSPVTALAERIWNLFLSALGTNIGDLFSSVGNLTIGWALGLAILAGLLIWWLLTRGDRGERGRWNRRTFGIGFHDNDLGGQS